MPNINDWAFYESSSPKTVNSFYKKLHHKSLTWFKFCPWQQKRNGLHFTESENQLGVFPKNMLEIIRNFDIVFFESTSTQKTLYFLYWH